MKSGGKVALLVVAVGVAASTGYFGYDSYTGKRLVRELCAKDGGLKIYETTYARGYFDETISDWLCAVCYERLWTHQFEYIDVRVPEGLRVLAPGYYRVSTVPRTTAQCPTTEIKPIDYWVGQLRDRVPENECATVVPLKGLPEEPVLRHKVSGYRNGGKPSITVDEWSIKNSVTDEPLADLREYLFYSRWNAMTSFGPMNPSARCSTFKEKLKAMLDLVPKTLRDQTKEISR